jgi:type VI secretion system secreted protein VgrG
VRFSTINSHESFRAARITPKPTINGPQTATVVGPAGKEIWTDKYGRVKVQFHWDRYGSKDENSSCWIRVAQALAGKKWGAFALPRIAQEVVVQFLEGDPDRPIITGCVYNADAMPPYGLPDEKTKLTLKTCSSKGAGGFNEIRFEDKKGEEQIFIHGEKNQDICIENDAFESIGHDRHLIVGNDQYEKVKKDKHLLVEGDQFEEVAGDKHQKVGGDHNQKVMGTLSIDAGMNIQERAGMRHALDAGMEIHLKAGMSVTLKASGNFININPAGIFINGTMLMLNSGGSPGSGSGSSPDSPQAPTAPKEADTAEAGQVTEVEAAPIQHSGRGLTGTAVDPYQAAQARALSDAAQTGVTFCEICQQG